MWTVASARSLEEKCNATDLALDPSLGGGCILQINADAPVGRPGDAQARQQRDRDRCTNVAKRGAKREDPGERERPSRTNRGRTAARVAHELQAQRTQPTCAEPRKNKVYRVFFPFGSSQLPVAVQDSWHLLDDSRSAALVVLRGRTDGLVATAAEARIARARAAAVETYLVAAGVAPARIRATWQPVGDHAADNGSAEGRALNRRVEIEIYRVAPEAASVDAERQS